ncbi:MAG TPA: TIGR04282 family arsenosugar biosynthesis glycosyltransferase [Chitinophagaceae bacterium]|nr:TIGR04282 family arsenosugar biosynthesis glycosyltransferase [Chitinophagaceae bacterium]
MIFTKNLVYGRVKTRLAATIGDQSAFEVYKALIAHTYSVTRPLHIDKAIFYDSYIEQDDAGTEGFQKLVQQGNDLGERMSNAFAQVLADGYEKAVVIGADCPELDEAILKKAFELLNRHDVVIGPAADGGYYLLGIKKLYAGLFTGISWSSPAAFDETIGKCKAYGLSIAQLPVLHDVDYESDLRYIRPATARQNDDYDQRHHSNI